jgi:pSer/pThr/pTyr-binding forkhead associated (FHA) protein
VAKLIVMFEGRELKDCVVGLLATIGRLPDNTIVIENPAVSGHHACVFRNGDDFVVEDLDSTNGTFVNEKRVKRHTLQNGDVLLVGKHKIVFDQTAGGIPVEPDEAEPMMSNLGDTVFLDTRKHKELLTRLTDGQGETKTAATASRTSNPGAAPAKLGVLRVLSGRADQSEYDLEARTSFIGKSDAALVRLRGWFKPKVAVAIARNGESYVATPFDGKSRINSEPLNGRHNLKDGDVLRVSGLTLEFRYK